MAYSKIVKNVIKNSESIENKMWSLLTSHACHYAVFHDGKLDVAKDFGDAASLGDEKHGEDSGFAVKKISKSIPSFASLI